MKRLALFCALVLILALAAPDSASYVRDDVNGSPIFWDRGGRGHLRAQPGRQRRRPVPRGRAGGRRRLPGLGGRADEHGLLRPRSRHHAQDRSQRWALPRLLGWRMRPPSTGRTSRAWRRSLSSTGSPAAGTWGKSSTRTSSSTAETTAGRPAATRTVSTSARSPRTRSATPSGSLIALSSRRRCSGAAVAGDLRRRTLATDDRIGASVIYPTSDFLAATGVVGGRVRDTNSAPVFGAHVVAVDPGGNVAAGALSQPDGGYQIRGLPPGRYAVYAEALGPDGGLVGRDVRSAPFTGAPRPSLRPLPTPRPKSRRGARRGSTSG